MVAMVILGIVIHQSPDFNVVLLERPVPVCYSVLSIGNFVANYLLRIPNINNMTDGLKQ